MIIIPYFFLILLILSCSFIIIAIIIEKKIKDSHPIKKWWKKHVISEYPYEDDDNF